MQSCYLCSYWNRKGWHRQIVTIYITHGSKQHTKVQSNTTQSWYTIYMYKDVCLLREFWSNKYKQKTTKTQSYIHLYTQIHNTAGLNRAPEVSKWEQPHMHTTKTALQRHIQWCKNSSNKSLISDTTICTLKEVRGKKFNSKSDLTPKQTNTLKNLSKNYTH